MTHQHEHQFTRDYRSVLICACGTEALPYFRTRGDYDRWRGHKGVILRLLLREQTVAMAKIKSLIDSANPSTHISSLRKEGYVITCTREGNESFYTLEAFTGTDNTKGGHCATCTCGGV